MVHACTCCTSDCQTYDIAIGNTDLVCTITFFVMSEIEKCLHYQECINRSVHLHESAHFIVQMTSQPVAVDCVNYSNF